jgi:hypothetical protein
MRRFFFILTPAASAFALACSDNAGVPERADPVPSFGAEVIRFEAPWPEVFIDDEAGLTLLAGATLDQVPALCAGGDFTDIASWLIVAHPTHDGRTVDHALIKDKDQSVIVWGAAVGSICDELQDVQPLAVGTARMTFTDNDFAGTSSHTDAFGERIEGTVTSPTTGQRYHLQAAYRILGRPDGPPKVVLEPFVRVTPVGGSRP